MTSPTRAYRFGDSSAPGVLLGLPLRQAIPVIAGIVWLAACLQTPLGIPGGLGGLVIAVVVAFGRWRGSPVADTLLPAMRLGVAARAGRDTWQRPAALLGTGGEALPSLLQGLELVEHHRATETSSEMANGLAVSGAAAPGMAVVVDRRRRTLTAVLTVVGRGFPLAAGEDQDRMLAGWGAAMSPFARPRSPVVGVTWQAWAGPADAAEHRSFLATTTGSTGAEAGGGPLLDYLALVDQQAASTREQRVLVTVTIARDRVPRQRSGHGHGQRSNRRSGQGHGPRHRLRLDVEMEVLAEEMERFGQRLEAAGLVPSGPLDAGELTAALRLRSDPTRAAQLATLTRSLAAAAGRASPEWGPMTVEPAWGHVRVDGSWHRTYRVAGWPQLPVPAGWLGALLGEPTATRTVCVVMEPVPIAYSARAADREAMAREADAEAKGRRGFRITALDRQRLSRVEDRERELAEGHAEFRFTGLVDITAPNPRTLEESTAAIEQAAAQSLIDLRPLDARHDHAWVACLPLGRNVIPRRAGL